MSYAKKHHKHSRLRAAEPHVSQDVPVETPAQAASDETPSGMAAAAEEADADPQPDGVEESGEEAHEAEEFSASEALLKEGAETVAESPAALPTEEPVDAAPAAASFAGMTAEEIPAVPVQGAAEEKTKETTERKTGEEAEILPFETGEFGAVAAESSSEASEEGLEETGKKARGEVREESEPSVPEAERPIEKAPKTHWLKRLTIALTGVVVIGLAGAAFICWDVYERALDMPAGVDAVEIMVEEGDSARRIIGKLREAGVAVEDRHLRILARLHPDAAGKIHTGLYRFERGITPEGVIAQFVKGPLIDQEVRIPDGATIWDVSRILSQAVNLKPVSANLDDEALRAQLGLADYPSIEGFVAPETYRYGSGSQGVAILRMAVDRQKKLLENAWADRSEECVLKTPYELLIMASIIEKETGEKSDRHLVSSVFNNRLKVGMPLQTDPAVAYGLGPDWKGRLTRKDLQTATPYNTYKIPALPPTPIAMPSAASIEAAANPAKSRYLYFVARGDGTSEFTTNLADHNKAVQHFILQKKTTPLNLPPKKTGKEEEKPLRAQ